MKIKALDSRLARREAESRVCRDRGDDELISASLGGVRALAVGRASARHVGLKPDLRLTKKREVISSVFLRLIANSW